MKISLDWLREYATLDAPVADLVRTLVDTGIEVDRVHRGPEGVVVARVLALEAVPESTKGVRIAEIDAGLGETTRVLTGAPNLKVGDLAPWAQPGSSLPGWDQPVEVRAMFGGKYESPGMLCSAVELGLGDDADGILILERGTPGMQLHEVLELDTVFDVEITPNRPDAMCHIGVARELTAGLGETLRLPPTSVPEVVTSAVSSRSKVSVAVESPGCRRFAGVVIEGIAVGPSPDWMQRRLRAIGLRPINNIVDVTNYVAWELGQPLHAFDLDLLTKSGTAPTAEVVVRDARAGESLALLDGTERQLADGDLVICSGEVPVSLAGIMGGSVTAVNAGTRHVLLESAAWDGTRVRATSRRLALRSDASTLFEKGLSDTIVAGALNRAATLIAELAGGHVLNNAIDEWPNPLPGVEPITVSSDQLGAILGCPVDTSDAATALARLGFSVAEEGDVLTVTPPHFRRDVSIPADIAEEVGRILGYDRVASTLPGRRIPMKTLAAEPALEDVARDVFIGAGFDEAITWSFVSPRVAARIGGIGGARDPIRVRNPLSDEWSVMRTSALPGLCQALASNLNRGVDDVWLFEIGRVFWEGERRTLPAGSTPDGADAALPALPAEPLVVATVKHSTDAATGAESLRHVIAVLSAVVERVSGQQLVVEPGVVPGMHPGRCAQLCVGDAIVGVVGELAPSTTEEFELKGRAAVGELRLDAVASGPRTSRYHQPPKFPAIVQDLAVVVSDDVLAGTALAAITEAGGRILEHAELYDQFRDDRLGQGRKGWTFRLTFRAAGKTLTTEDARAAQDAIAVALNVRCGATVRS